MIDEILGFGLLHGCADASPQMQAEIAQYWAAQAWALQNSDPYAGDYQRFLQWQPRPLTEPETTARQGRPWSDLA